MNANKDDHEKLAEMIKEIQYAMMTTIDAHGKMHARPMITMAFENNEKSEGSLWFFSKKDTIKVHDIEEDQEVIVAYSQPATQKYLAVYGLATIETDKLKMVELWNPSLKTWFPRGLEDPDLVMIKVEVESAEIWDAPPSKVIKFMGIAKSVVTGHHYQEKSVESRHIGLKIN